MEDCDEPRCHDDKHITCHHRFDFNSFVITTNGYIGFLQFFDFQIVLHFLYLIQHKKVPNSKRCRFIIVTKDKSFLRSAKNEWQKKAKINTHPRLEFGDNFVRNGKITIWVEEISTRPYGEDKHAYRKQLIERLNKCYGRRTS